MSKFLRKFLESGHLAQCEPALPAWIHHRRLAPASLLSLELNTVTHSHNKIHSWEPDLCHNPKGRNLWVCARHEARHWLKPKRPRQPPWGALVHPQLLPPQPLLSPPVYL